MESYFTKIENFIINKQINDYPEELQDKVIYLLQGGKRLRPILCILFSGLDSGLDNTKDIIYTMAYCIETLHCLSLVLDDLPEMDNDILRRGVESFHIKYGSDYTNFFIYYILNRIVLSMNIVLDVEEDADEFALDFKIDIANQIHKLFTSNLNMLIDGQYNDLELGHTMADCNTVSDGNTMNTMVDMNNLFLDEKLVILSLLDYDSIIKLLGLEKNNNLEAEYDTECDEEWNLDFDILFDATIDKINININLNMKKTSSLFNLSVCTGYLLQLWAKNIHINTLPHANTHNDTHTNTILNKLNIWSNVLGYMFQISDDILDINDDKEKGNPNICTIIGKENTYSLLVKGCEWLNNMIIEINEECRDTECIVNNIDFNLDIIKQIIEKILKRVE